MVQKKNKTKQNHYEITIISLTFIKPSEGLGLSQKQKQLTKVTHPPIFNEEASL